MVTYLELLRQRSLGCPVSYLTGEKEFWSLTLEVSKDTLIPRPDTETLVESTVEQILKWQKTNKEKTCSIAELGTGTAAIPLALCTELKNLHITSVDCSEQILAIAARNIHSYKNLLAPRNNLLDLVQSNMFSAIDLPKKLDFIVSNPPYIPSDKIADLQTEVSQFEPRNALDGGKDGLFFYRYLLSAAPGMLKRDGKMILEASPNWDLGGQTGNANRVEIDTKSGKFLAKGNVEMELTKARGVANFLFPMDEGESSSEDNSPTSVTCALFEYIRSFENSHFDAVKFNGDVFLTGKNGFNLKANSIYMEIDSIKKDLNIINAIGDLSGSTIGQNSMRFNGDRLNYDKNSKIVRLLGNPHVEIHTEQDGAEVVAFGSEAQYKTEEGSMVLLGNPLLKTPQGVLGGDRVVYDQKEKRLRASGNWKMTLSSKLILQKRDKSD